MRCLQHPRWSIVNLLLHEMNVLNLVLYSQPVCSFCFAAFPSEIQIFFADIHLAPLRILHVFFCCLGARYEGSWVDDQRHGQGTYVYASGAMYEGGWEEGRMHGRGCYTSASGSRYEGAYR